MVGWRPSLSMSSCRRIRRLGWFLDASHLRSLLLCGPPHGLDNALPEPSSVNAPHVAHHTTLPERRKRCPPPRATPEAASCWALIAYFLATHPLHNFPVSRSQCRVLALQTVHCHLGPFLVSLCPPSSGGLRLLTFCALRLTPFRTPLALASASTPPYHGRARRRPNSQQQQ